jgi:mono/diheme cytochrome c family protein
VPGNAARGKGAYLGAGCYTCHGTVGQGGAGARLAPNPRAQAGFMAYVRSGRRGWSVSGGMPAYPVSMLPDAALADIYAYLTSIPAPRPAAQIPLLKD